MLTWFLENYYLNQEHKILRPWTVKPVQRLWPFTSNGEKSHTGLYMYFSILIFWKDSYKYDLYKSCLNTFQEWASFLKFSNSY